MAKESSLKFVEAIETGEMDLDALRGNFDNLEEVINEHADEIKALASRQTQTISFCVDTVGLTTILKSNKHLRINITNAFVQMGDNIANEEIVELVGISNSIKFSATEKAGKVRVFNILKNRLIFHEDIIVKTTSDRRVIVNVTFESTEGDN